MIARHRRGPWSSHEDNHLLHLVQTQGAHNWVRISQLIQSRSPKQCRERYHQNLKPSLNLDPITPEEGVMIERMVADMGKRWAEIARRLNGRSDNAVKNWWNGGMNRRKRMDNRRAEMPPRQPAPAAYSLQVSQTQPAQQFQVSPDERHAAPAPYQYASEHPPAYPYNQTSQSTQSTGYLKPTLNTAAGRAMVEPPIPSPSTTSCTSRADSSDGSAPSLISDISHGSFHVSPHASPYTRDLPPLIDPVHPHRRPSQTSYPVNSSYSHSYASDGPDKKTAYQSAGTLQHHYPSPPPAPQPQHHHQQQQQPPPPPQRSPSEKLPFDGQLPLPNFRTITAPEPRIAPRVGALVAPHSPPKDTRMDLSAVMH